MIRVIIQNTILFLLPTAIYVAYVLVRNQRTGQQSARQVLDEAPLVWLFALGAALAFGMLFLLASPSTEHSGEAYVPPSFQDGKPVPGRWN